MAHTIPASNEDSDLLAGAKTIEIATYDYPLPAERIAQAPLPERDGSKLLLYKGGQIADKKFKDLPDLLPAGALLVLNDTRVVPARLQFLTNSGSPVEIFCLHSYPSSTPIEVGMASKETATWQCLVGGRKRWKDGETLIAENESVRLEARLLEKVPDGFLIAFSWAPIELSFAEVLHLAGRIPLPPYINRAATDADRISYQTHYATHDGAVAAPTAGLHFTPAVLEALQAQGVELAHVTLHVGAGTFRPVSAESMGGHTMHSEEFRVSRTALQQVLAALKTNRPIIPVGTTALRTLESLYWLALRGGDWDTPLDQWAPYQRHSTALPTAAEVFERVLSSNDAGSFAGATGLLILPGYPWRVTGGLVTNFHQPRSTLLLLVSALVGQDWQRMYGHALANDYRFLSYGDSSLLLP